MERDGGEVSRVNLEGPKFPRFFEEAVDLS